MALPASPPTVLTLSGELDVTNSPELRERLYQMVDEGHTDLVVDMSTVTFLDSSTLGVLIGVRNRLGEVDGTLQVVCDQERVLKVFRLTGLDQVFTIRASLD